MLHELANDLRRGCDRVIIIIIGNLSMEKKSDPEDFQLHNHLRSSKFFFISLLLHMALQCTQLGREQQQHKMMPAPAATYNNMHV